MKKRILSMILCFAMCLSFLPLGILAADAEEEIAVEEAPIEETPAEEVPVEETPVEEEPAEEEAIEENRESVSYLDENGEEQFCEEYTLLTNANINNRLLSGWYYAAEDLETGNAITLEGDVHLILAAGAALAGIGISERKKKVR